MSKKTLIELCMSPDLGGLELYMVQLAKDLASEFNIISVINTDTKLDTYYDEDSNVVKLKKNSKIFMFGAARKLAKLIDKNSVEIIHIHWTKDIPFVVLAKMMSNKKPKLVQTRHMTMTRFKDDFYHRMMYKQLDLILPITHQVKEQLEKYIPLDVRPDIQVLYNGVDKHKSLGAQEILNYKQEFGFEENSFNVGMVGRINEAKGQHLLIKALKEIKNKNIHVYFVGHEMTTGYIDELKALAKEFEVDDMVHFLGFLKNTYPFYQLCDIIVLASKRETFGLVLIEAMSAKTAVIGSNSGGVVEIIDDEKTGLLFEAGSFTSLAQKIETLVNDRGILEKIAQKGQLKCKEKFSKEKQTIKLVEILNKEL
ncbi:MAG: glycosyltransferase family 4 protein [Campylobacterota bacterium]|nr:glycosyltransferase family 4 protein [Campylobacterota bacterium]